MKTIVFDDPHRRKHFDFFRGLAQPHFNITANVDITRFLAHIKEQRVDGRAIAFTPAVVYCIARTANSIPAFRQRIRGHSVVEHDVVHPNFTVLTEASEVFGFCNVDYHPGFATFVTRTLADMERATREPSFEDDDGRDDYLFLSSFPWVSFTGFIHAMPGDPPDSVPRVVWGKYFHDRDRVLMPLSVQAHHAVVDGRHTGQYFELIQNLFLHPETLESS